MKTCKKCQTEVAESFLICPKCGSRDFVAVGVVANKPASSPVTSQKRHHQPRKKLRPFMQVSLLPKRLVYSAIAGVLVFIVILFSSNNYLADKVAMGMSPDAERELLTAMLETEEGQKIRQHAFGEYHSQSRLVQRIANDLVRELPEPVGFDYQFYVIPDSTINAFAMPGGMIVVFSGLINAVETPERLAAVLAHEISHAEQRHMLRQQYRTLGTLGLTAMIFGVAQDRGTIGMAELTVLKYSRDMEREADRGGANLLARAGVSPKVMVEMLTILGEEEGGWAPTILQTHPSPESRSRLIAKMPTMQLDLPMVNPAWHFQD